MKPLETGPGPFLILFRNAIAFAALFLLLFSSRELFGQISQPARFEVDHKSGQYNYTVLSMGDQGMALMHQVDKYEGNKNFWEVILLDSALQRTWSSEVDVNNQCKLIGYDFINGEAYFLFRKGDSDQGTLYLIQVRAAEHLLTKYEIETKLNFSLSYFNIIGRSALLGGYVSRQPAIFMYELPTGRSKVVPGYFLKNTELLDVRANQNGTFNTLMMDRSSAGKRQLVVRTMDESGALIVDDAIEIESGKSILTGVTSTLQREELLVTGTWGLANGKIALGIYTVLVDPFNNQSIQYYDFSQFNHFLDFNSPRKAARIKAKANRRKKAGKLPSFGVYVNTSRLVENPDGFVVLSEVYSPASSSTSYNPMFGPPYGYGSNYYSPYSYGYDPYAFNSYGPRYSPYGYGNQYHRTDVNVKFASVAVIDKDGKLLEDTGMNIKEVRLPALDQVSDFLCDAGRIVQVYRNEKELNVATTERGDDVIVLAKAPISMLNQNETLKRDQSDEGSLRHWFRNYFFVWGYETLKEKNQFGSRNVFYVNKLKAD